MQRKVTHLAAALVAGTFALAGGGARQGRARPKAPRLRARRPALRASS
jgi:hypothetical protein